MYGGSFLYDDFGVALNGTHLSGHNRHWDVEPQTALLSLCLPCGPHLMRLHLQGKSPCIFPCTNRSKAHYHEVQVLLPSFLMRFSFQLPSHERPFSACLAIPGYRRCFKFEVHQQKFSNGFGELDTVGAARPERIARQMPRRSMPTARTPTRSLIARMLQLDSWPT